MRVYIEAYGCTANKCDESLILGQLHEAGIEIVEDEEDADVVIVVTCVVIDATEQRMLSRLRRLKGSDKRVVVAGCMASVNKRGILEILPDALLLPPRDIPYIVDVIKGNEHSSVQMTNKASFTKFFSGVAAPIAIAEGCMFSCSYCITHLARGRLQSFPICDIIDDVKWALERGCKEIYLTAQDTGSYGLDSGDSLSDLLKEVCAIPGEFRVRVGMMNPRTLGSQMEDLLVAFEDEKIYSFIHLPVQSGDDDILKGMKRHYDVGVFEELVHRFRSKFTDIMLATDIIVAFPGETDEQFESSVDLIRRIEPDAVNITRFSARQGTQAKRLPNRILTSVAKTRSRTLTKVALEVIEQRDKAYVGRRCRGLVVKKTKRGVMCRADTYKPVNIDVDLPIGRFVDVEITGRQADHIYGRLI